MLEGTGQLQISLYLVPHKHSRRTSMPHCASSLVLLTGPGLQPTHLTTAMGDPMA